MKLLRKIAGLPNAALRGIAEHFAVRWLRALGSRQDRLGRAYRWAEGKKSLTAVLIGGCGFIAEGLNYTDAGIKLEAVAAFLLAAGLADKAVRQVGRPDVLANSTLYRLLADHSGALTTLLGSAWAYVTSTGCAPLVIRTLELSCEALTRGLGVATLAFVYLGIVDVAFLGKTPLRTPKVG